jgi:hypothetical protein
MATRFWRFISVASATKNHCVLQHLQVFGVVVANPLDWKRSSTPVARETPISGSSAVPVFTPELAAANVVAADGKDVTNLKPAATWTSFVDRFRIPKEDARDPRLPPRLEEQDKPDTSFDAKRDPPRIIANLKQLLTTYVVLSCC